MLYLFTTQKFIFKVFNFYSNSLCSLNFQTKAVDVHICVSKVLVNCVLGPLSPAARDPWSVLLEKFQPPSNVEYSSDEILSNLLQRLLSNVLPDPHPNSRQVGLCNMMC